MEVGAIKNLGVRDQYPGRRDVPVRQKRHDPLLFRQTVTLDGGIGPVHRGTAGPMWQRWEVQNMGSPINSPADDFGITFHADGEKGFFSSNRDDARGYDHIYSFEYLPPVISGGGCRDEPRGGGYPRGYRAGVGSDGGKRQLNTDSEGAYRFEADAGVEYLSCRTRRVSSIVKYVTCDYR